MLHLAWVLIVAITLPGCLLVAAGAAAGGAVAGTAYVMGDLEATVQATPPEVVSATRATFERMKILLVSAGATSLDGKVIGRTASDEKITITVESTGPTFSEISIRVGTFGDEEFSRRIYEEILRDLPARQAGR